MGGGWCCGEVGGSYLFIPFDGALDTPPKNNSLLKNGEIKRFSRHKSSESRWWSSHRRRTKDAFSTQSDTQNRQKPPAHWPSQAKYTIVVGTLLCGQQGIIIFIMSGHHGGYNNMKLECGYQLKSGGAAVERERYTVWALTRLLTQSGAVKRWTQSLGELIGRLLIVRFMTNCFCPHNNNIIAELRHWFYRMAHTPSHSIISQSTDPTDNAHCLWRCGTNTFIMLRCHWVYWFGSIDYRLVAIL